MSGHEICGKVLSLGSKVPEDKGPRVGDVVVVYPWPGCGQCEICSTENWQLCDERGSTAVHAVDGGSVHAVDGGSPVPRTDASEETNASLASFQASNHSLGCLKPRPQWRRIRIQTCVAVDFLSRFRPFVDFDFDASVDEPLMAAF